MTLDLIDIHKRFGPIRANDGVSLHLERGAIHGILGENGAGKSTLMKILSGFIPADRGEILMDGVKLDLASPKTAMGAGIGMLHQDPLVFLPLPVLDNFMLGSPGGGLLSRSAAQRELERLSEQFGFRFDPDASARSLTVGERQQLEITRLLWLGARVLILDEPTTGISAIQRVQLFETLRALAGEGMIIIFVSHKLEEVEELCERVTVMRRGRVVGEADMPFPTERLVEMMFGQVLLLGERPPAEQGDPALELESVTLHIPPLEVEDLSLSVRAGEVVGLAGMEGSGQRTFLQACAGLVEARTGRVMVGGRDLTGGDYRDYLSAGVHYLPAGRLEEGLIPGLTITEHFVLADGDQRFFVDWGRAKDRARERITRHSIKGTPDSTCQSLSGGNQQRLLLAMLPPDLRVLLMEHPTRGLDIESAEWVWSQLLQRRTQGTAIVFASADLDELLRQSDRIGVFFAGRIIKVLDAAKTGGEELGYLIGGKELV